MSKTKPQTLTKPLKQAIENSGLSIRKLAKESGIPQPVLHRFVSGQRGITLETADKLAKYLKLRLTD